MGCKCETENTEEKIDELKSSQNKDISNNIKPEVNQNLVERPNDNDNIYKYSYVINDLCPIDPKTQR